MSKGILQKKLTIDRKEDGVFGVFFTASSEEGKQEWKGRFFSIERMIELTQKAPIRYVFLEYLRPHLDVFCWEDAKGNAITPNMVIECPELYTKHAEKIISADLCYPILLSADKKVVYDGMHRFGKSFFSRKTFIL